jgi:membrane protease YdiL (CAAX protease family)
MSADTAARFRGRGAVLAGLAVALGGPAVLTLWSPVGIVPANDGTLAILLNEGAVWALALLLLAIVVFWERLPLASIGLVRPTPRALAFGALVTVGLIALADVAQMIVETVGVQMDDRQAGFLLGLPVWLQMAVSASAGFTEEVMFRGYPIERLTRLTGRRWLGALIPMIIFGALHAPFWGWPHALIAGLSGLWLTLLYLWRRNLWTNIAAHALMDAAAFLAVDFAGTPDSTNA